MNAIRELLVLYLTLAIVPLGPMLAVTHLDAAWQANVLTSAWAVCWYAWILGKLRQHE
ncbi:MAG: hypothetical protein WD533_01900 [Dehalococcoidia bacterium]